MPHVFTFEIDTSSIPDFLVHDREREARVISTVASLGDAQTSEKRGVAGEKSRKSDSRILLGNRTLLRKSGS